MFLPRFDDSSLPYLSLHHAFGFAALAITTYIVAKLFVNIACNPLRKIPGPFSTRVSGLSVTLQGLKGRRVYKLEEYHKKYGSIVRIGPNEVSVADWVHLRAIYNSKSVVKEPSFYGAGSFIGKNNIFQMLDTTEHAGRRKLSSPPYSTQSVGRLNPLIEQSAQRLVRRLILEANSSATHTADAYKLCGLFSFETICQAAFAKDFSNEDGQAALSLLKAMDGAAPTLIITATLPFIGSTGLGRRLPGPFGDAFRNFDYWEKQSRVMVDHFLEKSTSEDQYLLSPLATGIDSFLGRRLTHEELVEEAMGYMFAGSGTTSSTLTYLLYAISLPENANIQERLRQELMSLSTRDVSALRQSAYLNAVIKETMRLFPTIISTLPRVTMEPLQLGDYVLPKGTVIGMQNWIHHRDPNVFPHPERFFPDRWLQSTAAMDGSFTPFSIGRRNCIGQNLAWEELYIAVNEIMRAGLRLRIGQEMKPDEMDMEDRFNVAPKGHRLMLEVTKI